MVEASQTSHSGKCIQVAALPWRLDSKGRCRILLVTSRENGKWMLPKGWPMDGKSHSQSAAQEALEEAGVEGKISDTPIGSYHYTKLLKDRSSLHAQGLIFPLNVDRLRNRWAEDDQRRRRWFRQEQAARSVFEPDLARFLAGLELARLQLF